MSTTPTPEAIKAAAALFDGDFVSKEEAAVIIEREALEQLRADLASTRDELNQAYADNQDQACKYGAAYTQWRADLSTATRDNASLAECLAALRADLARVTAERDDWKDRAAELHEALADNRALRARVAELEFDAEFQKQYAEAGDVKLAQERATVAEVVPALRNCMDMLEELDGLNWGDDGMPFTIAWDHLNPILKRAESATPAKHPDTVRPRIVCLCGSTRFKDCFESTNEAETLAGKVVLPPGCFSRSTPEEAARGIFKGCTEQQKVALDALHKRKIDMADEVLVLNVNGYVGESTRSEIEYARSAGKPVRWLECDAAMKGGAHD